MIDDFGVQTQDPLPFPENPFTGNRFIACFCFHSRRVSETIFVYNVVLATDRGGTL
jgi:hypothetical protein